MTNLGHVLHEAALVAGPVLGHLVRHRFLIPLHSRDAGSYATFHEHGARRPDIATGYEPLLRPRGADGPCRDAASAEAGRRAAKDRADVEHGPGHRMSDRRHFPGQRALRLERAA